MIADPLLEDVIASYGADEASRYIAIADHFLQRDERAAAAAALDRAYGLAPDDPDLARHRAAILDEIALTEHGIAWRYVPAGTFAMGSSAGDPDERPVHPVRLAAYWIMDVPMSWTRCCALANYSPPPHGWPNDELADRSAQFRMISRNKIRRQYAARSTADDPADYAEEPPTTPLPGYDTVPMAAGAYAEALAIAARLSTETIRYSLPTEAQWEKAARGGLVGKRYAWGDAPPTTERCDFDHMGVYEIGASRARPANGYGVFAMCGGIAEWTLDEYDALAYATDTVREVAESEGHVRPERARAADPDRDPGPMRVLRGGCWTDCADAVTVSRRTARPERWGDSPTIGFRLVRFVVE